VREADALVQAGHQVRVVAPLFNPALVERDRALMAHRRWRLERVDFLPQHGRLRSLWIRGRRRLAQEIALRFATPALAEHSYTLAASEMRELAAREPADWFIAHTQASLPAAAAAAVRWKARLGFDCEDLLAYAPSEPSAFLRAIEARYLPRCAYVSVASPLMAEQLARDHRIATPTVLYNVFPLELADGMLAPRERRAARALRLHWFGQTIGTGRGLEEAVAALAHLPGEVELHLRGNPSAGYRERLEALAGGERQRLFFLPPLDHDELIRAMESFDVGLALERPDNGNYSRTVTNKLFSYLVAGLALAVTDTPGQRELMSQIPAAGFLYPAGDPRALAESLLKWVRDRQSLRAAQQASWEAARTRFSWNREQEKFLALFMSAAPAEAVLAGGSVVS
jgi:glycosyltransferase involved in cell wall biosynthesis